MADGRSDWSAEDRRFLEAVGRLIANGWRTSEKYVHYQQVHARLDALMPDEYTEDDVERFCLRVFDMGGDGYMRLKRIYKRYNVRMLRAEERLVRTSTGAASVQSNALPLDDAGIGGQSAVKDDDLTPWLEALPSDMQVQSERMEASEKMTIPDNQEEAVQENPKAFIPTESAEAISRNFERQTAKAVNIRNKHGKLRLALEFIPVIAVAILLVFLPLKFVAGFLSGAARKGHRKHKEAANV